MGDDPTSTGSPTLTQVNSSDIAKRTKGEVCPSLSPYHSSPSSSSYLPYSSSPSDQHHHPPPATCTIQLSNTFERESSDPLSESFKCLYKSIFGNSVSSGEYLNPPPLPLSLSANDSGPDSPLAAEALASLDPTGSYSPYFYSLMDSFKDIAATDSWDNLDQAQVQGFMDSFKVAKQDRFGLDSDAYSQVSAHFDSFLHQLHSRFITGTKGSDTTLNELEYCHDVAALANTDTMPPPLHLGSLPPLPPKYTHSNSIPPFPVSDSMTSSYSASDGTPSPHSHASAQVCMETNPILIPSYTQTHYAAFSAPFMGSSPPVGSTVPHRMMADMPIKSATNDVFDDDDDFDWSKLM